MDTAQSADTSGATRKNAKFWRRQFAPNITTPQIIFDVILGAIAPVLCFLFDPIAFRGWMMAPLFPEYQTFAYLFSGVQIVILCTWLAARPANSISNQLIAGSLLCGALFCVITGLILAPYSLLGLMFGVGVFGFTPFFTAFVYVRNSVRAVRSGVRCSVADSGGLMAAAFAIVFSLPLLLSLSIRAAARDAVNDILQGDSRRADLAAHRLVPLQYLAEAEVNKIVDAYLSEKNEARKAQLKSIYRQITGADIDVRARPFND